MKFLLMRLLSYKAFFTHMKQFILLLILSDQLCRPISILFNQIFTLTAFSVFVRIEVYQKLVNFHLKFSAIAKLGC
jgi:hypothetical protein